jgi:hypothetical protein
MYCRLNNIGAEITQAKAGTTDEFWFDYRKEQAIVLFSYTVGIVVHTPKQSSEVVKLTTYIVISPSAEVKNEWLCTSIHHYAFHVHHKDNFASSFYEVQNYSYLEFPTSFPL